MAETFLFYDIETTGLSRAYDQILEFAAIRTDAGLNEIERFSASLRLRQDVIPSPAAILVNRIRTDGTLLDDYLYTYDGAKNQLTEQHASTSGPKATTETTTFEYDSRAQVVRVQYGDSKTVAYTYDLAGNVVSITDANNGSQRQCFTYDALDRLTAARVGDASCNGSLGNGEYADEGYTYDAITGNLASKTADAMFQVFESLVAEGKTILLVTHDRDLAARATRRVHIADGQIVDER